MRCARPGCPRRADVVVAFGAGLLVLLCYQDGVFALAERANRTVRALRRAPRLDDPPEQGVTG